jgi:hypothetical protein
MMRLLLIQISLVFLNVAQLAIGQSCPAITQTVTSKFIMATPPDASLDSMGKLPGCLGLKSCQMTSIEWGQCGSAKAQRLDGAQKAATIVLTPSGCSEVYNCNGVLVDTDTYNSVSRGSVALCSVPSHLLHS